MKKYTYVACSDAGQVKTINEDSLLIKHIRYKNKDAIVAVICDGVGGLPQGEVASASLIHAFCEAWKPAWISNDTKRMQTIWTQFLQKWNEKIRREELPMATTCTALMIIEDTSWLFHVGDSRLYTYDQELIQWTMDHSQNHKLMECIGYFKEIHPQVQNRTSLSKNYFLCSDGMYRKLTEQELIRGFQNAKNKIQMKRQIQQWIHMNLERNETDNMSAIWIRVNQHD